MTAFGACFRSRGRPHLGLDQFGISRALLYVRHKKTRRLSLASGRVSLSLRAEPVVQRISSLDGDHNASVENFVPDLGHSKVPIKTTDQALREHHHVVRFVVHCESPPNTPATHPRWRPPADFGSSVRPIFQPRQDY